MKKGLLILLFFPLVHFAQSDNNPCETLTRINELIQEQHYKPKKVNDSLSVFVFNTFINSLDEDNRLFTQNDIETLKKHQYKIDNYVIKKNCNFITDFYNVYTAAIERYKTTIDAIKNEPFPYSSSESIEFSKNNFPYAKDVAELKKLYKKRLLFHVLKDMAETSTNKDSITANFETLFTISKEKIFESYYCKYSNFQMSTIEFNSKFFVAFCSYFDPHTVYLSENDKSSFLSSVSADNLSFGMLISTNEKDEIIIDEIVPGSAAYLTGKIDHGDQIIKIKHLNDEFTIACTSMSKVETVFSSNEYQNVDFTLRKKSGEIYTVTLSKKIMKDYENDVNSYILEKNNKKTGYIKIPSFYAKFENGKSNVSDDVAKEIYKLKEDNINGLIIDLQNNGGGSMDEAIKLVGSFIDIGPIAIMNNKEFNKETIKDRIRGSVYSGPLVILINGFSASASEFFTNAMQDYNRAIIVGNQSYGKASIQRILPLTNDKSPEEYLKLTIEEFYRITGKSNQTVGITPDIEIPTLFNNQMPREIDERNALENDKIKGVFQYTEFSNPLKDITIEKSLNRLKKDKAIQAISDLNTKIDSIYDADLQPILLEFNSVFNEVTTLNSLWKEIKETTLIEYPLIVSRNSVDIKYQVFDDFLKSCTSDRIKSIKNNLHIIEGVNIINDLNE